MTGRFKCRHMLACNDPILIYFYYVRCFFPHVRFSVVTSHVQHTFTDRKLRRHSWTTPTSVLESMLIAPINLPWKVWSLLSIHTCLYIQASQPKFVFGQPNPWNCWPRKDQLQHCCQRCSSCWSLAFFLGNLGTLAVKSGWDLNVIHRRNQWIMLLLCLIEKYQLRNSGLSIELDIRSFLIEWRIRKCCGCHLDTFESCGCCLFCNLEGLAVHITKYTSWNLLFWK